jgi:hypothetical protein
LKLAVSLIVSNGTFNRLHDLAPLMASRSVDPSNEAHDSGYKVFNELLLGLLKFFRIYVFYPATISDEYCLYLLLNYRFKTV